MPLVLLLVIIVGGIVLYWTIFKDIIVFEFERGLKYRKGKFKGVLDPGRYRYRPKITTIRKVDMRPRFVSISGQEVLSADGTPVKGSAALIEEIRNRPGRALPLEVQRGPDVRRGVYPCWIRHIKRR